MESANPGDKPQDPIVDLGQEREEAVVEEQGDELDGIAEMMAGGSRMKSNLTSSKKVTLSSKFRTTGTHRMTRTSWT